MIAVSDLSQWYSVDKAALQNVSLSVADGELVALLGANGAGKSTLINCALDFISPTSGDVLLDGISVGTRSLDARRSIAYLPDEVSVYSTQTGLQNARFFTSLLRGSEPSTSEVMQAIQGVGLTEQDGRQAVSTYSKGMRQRLGIAIAILRGSRNLILDEPTAGLDPRATEDLLALLRSRRAAGCAVLMSTHDVFRALRDADRIALLRDGSLVLEADRSQLDGLAVEELIKLMGDR